MELVPKIPSERLIRNIHRSAQAVIVTLMVVTVASSPSIALFQLIVLVAGVLAILLPIRLRDIEIENATDRLECTAMTSARSVAVVALLAFVFGTLTADIAALLALGFSVALVVFVLFRDSLRAGFLARVYAGDEPELSVVRDTEVRGFELLPPVLSGTLTDAVIAHTSKTQDYRTSHGPRALARVTRSLAKMNARFAKRRRNATTLGAVAAGTIALSIVGPFRLGPSAHAKTSRSVDLVAPACTEALPYFEERLQSLPGVGRATLLTHDRDPSVAAGEGVLVYVPATGADVSPALDAHVLSAARAIPCEGKLALSIARPTYRQFRVTVEVTVEDGADEASVLRDVDEQVRELFEPDARAVYNEHFGFGATEKTFGYRIRHALRHVTGVKAAKLNIDGSDNDVALGPRDFPTLAALSIAAGDRTWRSISK